MDGLKKDMSEKRARYINKNNELCQEFFFSHPSTLFEINSIYNSHFTGSNLWDLFSKEAHMIENSWSCSIKIMFDLHRATHRYFLEPLCKKPHISKILSQRFLSFTQSIRNSKKLALSQIFNTIKNDCSSITGANLRQLMLKLNKDCIDDLKPNDAFQHEFAEIPEKEKWRIPIVQEIEDIKAGSLSLTGDGLSHSELNAILEVLTTE